MWVGQVTVPILSQRPGNKILPFIVFVIALHSVHATGQTAQVPPTDSIAGKQPYAVSVPFYVNDKQGMPVRITQADLSILDDRLPPQSVAGFQRGSEVPLRLGVLIDKSNSQRKSSLYRPGLEAAFAFLNQVLTAPEDRAFVELVDTVPTATRFMEKTQLGAIKMDATPGGGTALFDAVQLASNQLMNTDPVRPARRVLVILSDGGDNASHISLNAAIASAQRATTVVFTVSTSEEENARSNVVLERLAKETGGAAFLHVRGKNMPKVFSEIQGQIDGMYTVTYIPPSREAGRYREIEIRVTSDKHLHVRAPKGYYSASQ